MGYTQSTPEEKRQIRIDEIKSSTRKIWDGQPSYARVIEYTYLPDFRVVLEVSDEQYERIRQAPARGRNEWKASPEYEKMTAEILAIYERAGFRPPTTGGFVAGMANLNAESRKQLNNIASEMDELQSIAIDKAYEGILTPEQERKLHEMELANMNMFPILSLSMFEGLSLTDAQREQMKTLAKDFEPEFEKYCESYANLRVTHDEILFGVLNQQEGNLAEQMRATEKILAEDPEYKRIVEAIPAQQKAFLTRFLAKVNERNILTREQWGHLQKLFDDPPEHAKILTRKIQAFSGKSEDSEDSRGSEENKGAVWQPGPGSWKPGDAIPEQYRQDRNDRSRFPRGAE